MRRWSNLFLSDKQRWRRKLLASGYFSFSEDIKPELDNRTNVMRGIAFEFHCFRIAKEVREKIEAESMAPSSEDSIENRFEQALSENWEYQAVFKLFTSEQRDGVDKCSVAALKKQNSWELEEQAKNAFNAFEDAYARYATLLSLQALEIIQEIATKSIPDLKEKKRAIKDALKNLQQPPQYLQYIREVDELAECGGFSSIQRQLSTHFHELTIMHEMSTKSFGPAQMAKSAGAIAFMLEDDVKVKGSDSLRALNIPKSLFSYEEGKAYFSDRDRYGMALKLFEEYLKDPKNFPFNKDKWNKVVIKEVIEGIHKAPETNSREVSRAFNDMSIDKVLRSKEVMESIIDKALVIAREKGLEKNSIFITHQIVFRDWMRCIQKEFFDDSTFFELFFKELEASFTTTEHYIWALYKLFNSSSADLDNSELPPIDKIPRKAYEESLKIQIAFCMLSQAMLKDTSNAAQALAAHSFYMSFTNQCVPKLLTEPLVQCRNDPSVPLKTADELLREAIDELDRTIDQAKNVENYQNNEERLESSLVMKMYAPAYYESHDIADQNKVFHRIRRTFPSYQQDWDTLDPKEIESSYIPAYIKYMLNKASVSPEVGRFLLNHEKSLSLAKSDTQRQNFFNHISSAWREQMMILENEFTAIKESEKSFFSTESGRKERYEQLYKKIVRLYIKISGYPSFEKGIEYERSKFHPVYPKDVAFEAQFQSEYFRDFSEVQSFVPTTSKLQYWDLVILGKIVHARAQGKPYLSTQVEKNTQKIIQSLEESCTISFVPDAPHQSSFVKDCLTCIAVYFDVNTSTYHKIHYARALAIGLKNFLAELQKNKELIIYSDKAQIFLEKIAKFPLNETLDTDIFYKNVNTILQSITFSQYARKTIISEEKKKMICDSAIILTKFTELAQKESNFPYCNSALRELTHKKRPKLKPREVDLFSHSISPDSWAYKKIEGMSFQWSNWYNCYSPGFAHEQRWYYSSMCADLLKNILTGKQKKFTLEVEECFLIVRVLRDSKQKRKDTSPFYHAICLLATTDSENQHDLLNNLLNSSQIKALEEKYCRQLFDLVYPFLKETYLSLKEKAALNQNDWDKHFLIKGIRSLICSNDFANIKKLYTESAQSDVVTQSLAEGIGQFGAIKNSPHSHNKYTEERPLECPPLAPTITSL
jgi:hypothetical protein